MKSMEMIARSAGLTQGRAMAPYVSASLREKFGGVVDAAAEAAIRAAAVEFLGASIEKAAPLSTQRGTEADKAAFIAAFLDATGQGLIQRLRELWAGEGQ